MQPGIFAVAVSIAYLDYDNQDIYLFWKPITLIDFILLLSAS